MQSFPTSFSDGPIEASVEPTYAGFGIRAVARIIDMVVCSIVAIGAGITAGIVGAILNVAGFLDAAWVQRIEETTILGYVVSFLASLTYHIVSEWVGGASLGKLICGLRVAKEDLVPCTIGASIVRSLGYIVDALFFGLIAYSAMSKSATMQRFGDQWAHTVVVKGATVPDRAKRSALAVFAGIVVGFAAYFSLVLAETMLKLLSGA